MPDIDWSARVVGGKGPPTFKYWYQGTIQKTITLPDPSGVSKLRFIPDEIVFKDINHMWKSIHLGWDIEFVFSYQYLGPDEFKLLLTMFSLRSNEIDGIKIQCFPHNDLQFNFYGRFIDLLDFNYIADKYLGHSCTFIFRSTKKVQDIPRITANRIIHRRIW